MDNEALTLIIQGKPYTLTKAEAFLAQKPDLMDAAGKAMQVLAAKMAANTPLHEGEVALSRLLPLVQLSMSVAENGAEDLTKSNAPQAQIDAFVQKMDETFLELLTCLDMAITS